MSNYDDMRAFADDAICRFRNNHSEASNAVSRLAEMVMALTDPAVETGKKIIVPCLHMNGSGKDNLMKDLERAYTAVGAAYDALRKMDVNGRDYYVYGAGAYERARAEHHIRMLKIDDVRNEIEALVGGICDNKKEVEVKE